MESSLFRGAIRMNLPGFAWPPFAGRQHGRITSAQFAPHRCGRTRVIGNWTRAGYLHRRLRGVHAVGISSSHDRV